VQYPAVLLLDLQRLAGTHPDEVALSSAKTTTAMCAIALPVGVRVSIPHILAEIRD
jgi:hypothetical protein